MVPFQEALTMVLRHARPLEVISVPLMQAFGYCLAEPLVAQMDQPPFDNSAVDGFGVRVDDVALASPDHPVRLPLVATVRAGQTTGVELAPGTAIKILTGAQLPAGVEAVVMREHCRELPREVVVMQAVDPGEHIRRRGFEFRQGDLALSNGERVTPAVMGMLATLGYTTVSVHRKPNVALIITGNELVQPGHALAAGQIYDSNSFSLLSALHGMGIEACRLAHAQDHPDAIRTELAAALQMADVVMTVGGVSVGDYDFVREVCGTLGIKAECWRVAIKPGKPFYFGIAPGAAPDEEKLVFGLPGNPVSALLTFLKFVRPALQAMLGLGEITHPTLTATLTAPMRKKAGRLEFVRGVAAMIDERLVVTPTTGQDSHMLSGLAQANCLIHFPPTAQFRASGEQVTIEILEWN